MFWIHQTVAPNSGTKDEGVGLPVRFCLYLFYKLNNQKKNHREFVPDNLARFGIFEKWLNSSFNVLTGKLMKLESFIKKDKR